MKYLPNRKLYAWLTTSSPTHTCLVLPCFILSFSDTTYYRSSNCCETSLVSHKSHGETASTSSYICYQIHPYYALLCTMQSMAYKHVPSPETPIQTGITESYAYTLVTAHKHTVNKILFIFLKNILKKSYVYLLTTTLPECKTYCPHLK